MQIKNYFATLIIQESLTFSGPAWCLEFAVMIKRYDEITYQRIVTMTPKYKSIGSLRLI